MASVAKVCEPSFITGNCMYELQYHSNFTDERMEVVFFFLKARLSTEKCWFLSHKKFT